MTGLFGLIGFFVWEALKTPLRCKLQIKDVVLCGTPVQAISKHESWTGLNNYWFISFTWFLSVSLVSLVFSVSFPKLGKASRNKTNVRLCSSQVDKGKSIFGEENYILGEKIWV